MRVLRHHVQDAEERLRRRVARMRGASYPSSAVAAAGALPEFQQARSAAAAAVAQASGRVDALKPSIEGLADPIEGLADPPAPAPGRGGANGAAGFPHASQPHGERTAAVAAVKPLEQSAAPGPSGPASLPDPLGPVLAAEDTGGAHAQPIGLPEAGGRRSAAAQPNVPVDSLLPPAAAAAVPSHVAAHAGSTPGPRQLPRHEIAGAGAVPLQLGAQPGLQQGGSGEQHAAG